MVRQPKNLAEAKEIFREEKTKVTSSVSAIAGSRWLLAILATFVIAFGTHLAYAPSRLPTVGGIVIGSFRFTAERGLWPRWRSGQASDRSSRAE